MNTRRLIICLALVCGCSWLWKNPWKQVTSSDSNLGPALVVKRDKDLASGAPRSQWNTWVVLENPSPYPVQVAFQTEDGTTKYHQDQIEAGGKVALRVGPEDAKFLFRRVNSEQPLPPPPTLIDRVSNGELLRRYSSVSRL